MNIRHLEESDYDVISPRIDDWWGGRKMSGLLPRLFFQHFRPTSFVAEENGQILGFIVAFTSQTDPTVLYIHFSGVSPEARGRGVARILYEHVFHVAIHLGCTNVRGITSPVNKQSVGFHKHMGFQCLETGFEVDGIPVVSDYAGSGGHRVCFCKYLK